jgi:feruloyl esterase
MIKRTVMAFGTGTALIALAATTPPSAPVRATTPQSGLASACTVPVMSELAKGLSAGVTVKKIPNSMGGGDGTLYTAAKGNRPAFCQVTGSYVTNAKTGKTANFLATFPENWNGKFLQLGCSGGCGFILMNNPTAPPIVITAQGYPGQLIEKGYAMFGNDLGWTAPGPSAPLQWTTRADGSPDPDMVEDYLYRADMVMADLGKAFTKAFYTSLTKARAKISRSYYSGCSQGGRGALVAATRFPEKFDGIIAGSPAQDHPGIIFHGVSLGLRLQGGDVAKLTPGQVKYVNNAVLKQCDGADGVSDGLIQNPAACNFRPTRDLRICEAGKSGDDCLSQPQAEAVSSWVTGLTDAAGNLLQPGFSISDQPYASFPIVRADMPIDSHIRQSISRSFDGTPVATHRAGGPGEIDAYRGILDRGIWDSYFTFTRKGSIQPEDFARFMRGRGKLLWYHNLSDEALTPYMSINRYKALAARHGGYGKLQNSIRFFGIPGSAHCGMGGSGPSNFDAIGALEQWVEKKIAPNALLARVPDPKAESMIMGTVNWSKPSPRTMPLCAFPAMARYKGAGDINKAENWQCSAGDTRMLTVGETGKQAGVIR